MDARMLSDLQTKKLTRYFQVYDIDDDGVIRAVDFERILENIRILHGLGDVNGMNGLRNAYLARWEGLRRAADVDRDGGIDIDEWLAYWQIALSDDDRYEEEVISITDRLFTVFDLDEDDTIGVAEFTDFYGIFGLSASLAKTIFEELDVDGGGVITRDQLLEASRTFYRGNDVEAPGNLLFGPYGG
jgi:Ca2+-binding EF-hand superfamily protein